MSRLGDMLKNERTRQGLTQKQVAKLCGCAEKYINDVESGVRIIPDEQARRILKRIGSKSAANDDFSLDALAAATDLAAAATRRSSVYAQQRERERERIPDEDIEKPRAVASLKSDDTGGIFLNALADVLVSVPIFNAAWSKVGTRMLPIIGGKVEGGTPDKTLYFKVPDYSMRGFRILQNDLALIVPTNSPIDGAIMLVEYNRHRNLRKVKATGYDRVLLQSFDSEYEADEVDLANVTFIGKAVRIEIEL